MRTLVISSTTPYSGKSLVGLGLGLRFRKDKIAFSAMKAVGTIPVKVGSIYTDEDIFFFKKATEVDDPIELLSPVVMTHDLIMKAYKGELRGCEKKILDAHKKLSKGKDLVLIGTGGDLHTGMSLGVSLPNIIKKLDAKVILVDRYQPESCIDSILGARDFLKDRLIGVILNYVSPANLSYIRTRIVPFLEKRGVDVLGIIPRDRLLDSISVNELCKTVSGEVICCEDRMKELVERFFIGAMNVEKAMEHFKVQQNKAVIVGGDRPDIQLAALETATKCLILTGGMYPNDIILMRAKEARIPIIIVKDDTLTTVEKLASVLGRTRIREEEKILRGVELFDQSVDMDLIYKKIGLKLKRKKKTARKKKK